MPHIICTVTNDLTYDRRMQRICRTLVQNGYSVTLVGRLLPHSLPTTEEPFDQQRLNCRFTKGFLFYAEINIRLWLYLMRAQYDAVCSVDLDTLAAGCLATVLRRKKRLFDAHEYFTEVPEVINRPFVQKFWSLIARLFLPFYRHAYTVGPALADIFTKKYGIPFGVVRNMPDSTLRPEPAPGPQHPVLLYQGALNEGRGIECLLEAMVQLPDMELWLAGEGDLSDTLRRQTAALGIEARVRFMGLVKPADLPALTSRAWIGINVLENKGQSYYYSLANKFFDYVQAGTPVLTMDFPEYRALNRQFEVAILLKTLNPEAVITAIRALRDQPDRYASLKQEALKAREQWNWKEEQTALLQYWEKVFIES